MRLRLVQGWACCCVALVCMYVCPYVTMAHTLRHRGLGRRIRARAIAGDAIAVGGAKGRVGVACLAKECGIYEMGDFKGKGVEYEKKADKKLSGWTVFGSKYEDAADLLEKAGNSYKLAKAWDEAAGAYIKLASCQLKLDSKHEAAAAYVDAATCYKKSNPQEAVRMLNSAINQFEDIGKLSMAAKHYKEIADIYENDEDLEKAMIYYDKAADFYSGEGVESSANQCRLKVAQYAATLEQYDIAIEIYENVAKHSMSNSLLKYSVKGYLLNAGLCQICGKDIVAVHNAIEKYQEVDPTFSSTRECKLLQDLAIAIDEVDVEKFTDAVKEFDSMSRLDQWKTILLLRAKNALKSKEVVDDDLT